VRSPSQQNPASLESSPPHSVSRMRVIQSFVHGCAALVLLSATVTAQAAPPRAAIFRYVKLVDGTIALGKPLGWAARYATSPRDSVIDIPRDGFGGADAIRVTRSAQGVVRRIAFLYTAQRDFDELLAEYRTSLGAPADSLAVRRPHGQRKTWTWRDQQTEFVVTRLIPAADGVIALSEMIDRVP
jgi:hypothetical protein